MKNIIRYFLQGLIVVAPVGITLYILIQLFILLDSLNPFNIPGFGLILTLAAITLIGFIVKNYVNDRIGRWIDKQIKKAPLISIIYTSVQDLLKSFVGDRKSFTKPVLVKLYENSEIRRLGFVTNNNFNKLEEFNEGLITVYCPHSYNISGNVYLVPPHYVTKLNAKATDVMKYTVSGGVTRIENNATEASSS